MITYLSCCGSATGVSGAAMLVDVEEVMAAAVVDALDAVVAIGEVFVGVTAVVLLDWLLELVLVEHVVLHVFRGHPTIVFLESNVSIHCFSVINT